MKTILFVLKKALWLLTAIGAILGVATIAFGLASAESAPQEAAVAGIGVALAVIPYCLARAVDELMKPN